MNVPSVERARSQSANKTGDNPLHLASEKKLLGILSSIITAGILFATLWPFNFFPTNGVSWLVGTDGIRFRPPGVVFSKAPMHTRGGATGTACSLELLLRPASISESDSILSFSGPNNPLQFVVRQWTNGLLVTHDMTNAQGVLKRTKFDVDHAFQLGKLVLVTMTSGPGGTVVYLNDREAKVFPRFTITPDELSGEVVLGTNAEDYQPWPGEVRGMAIFSKELTAAEVYKHYGDWNRTPGATLSDLDGATAYYRFNEGEGRDIHNSVASGPDLEIPKWFKVPHKPILKSATREFVADWNYVNDITRNIAGFVPFGFLVCAYLGCTLGRRKAILYTVLAGGLLSFTIEMLQVLVPPRNSGVTDIITNTLGAALGALLARPALVRLIFERSNSSSLLGAR